MKTSVKITEKQLKTLVNEVDNSEEVKEDLIGGVKDIYQGAKGFFRGHGFPYFKHLSKLQRLMSKLKKLDDPNHKVMTELEGLKNNITSSKMPQDKKDELVKHIDLASDHFKKYADEINQIESLSKQTLN